MNSKEAAYKILKDAGEPLHYKEITKRMLDEGLWTTKGKTPSATVSSRIAMDIKTNGDNARFSRVERGIYKINPQYDPNRMTPVRKPKSAKHLSFTKAAEKVLDSQSKKEPMHYRDITKRALDGNLLRTSGKTPEATMYAQILTEIQRMENRGEKPRFVKHGKGMVSLSKWAGRDLHYLISKHNEKVRNKLLEKVKNVDPDEFEILTGNLLTAMGFEDVEVTQKTHDGGVDVRGTLVVGDVIRTSMAVQAKRWKNNVRSPTVQQVRGSLGTHEQGLIITTSDFSKGAREEAERSDAIPIGLMDGKQLVKLLVEYDIGVKRSDYKLFDIDEAPLVLDGDEE